MWIILLAVLGLLVYFFVQRQNWKSQVPEQKEGPLDILQRRYAKGEIEGEEYEKKKKVLEE